MENTVRLNNGVEMPRIGYGVYQIPSSITERCVRDAIQQVLGEEFSKKSGTILVTGGGFGLYPMDEFLPLSMDKAALRAMCIALHNKLKEQNVYVGTLAESIGCSESTLSRFLSGAVNKLSDENLIAIAKYFCVSTDFLLGLTDIPDRKNFDIEELGLSAGAAKALYTNKTTSLVVNALLENKSFPELAQMIRQYAEGTMAAGYAAQNQMYSMLTAMLMGENAEASAAVKALRAPAYQADLTHIQTAFTKIVQQFREDNSARIEAARAVTKEVMQKMIAELPKGEDLRTVTPEQILDAMTSTVRGMDGVTEEQLAAFRKGVLPLFLKPAEDIEDADADE